MVEEVYLCSEHHRSGSIFEWIKNMTDKGGICCLTLGQFNGHGSVNSVHLLFCVGFNLGLESWTVTSAVY